MTRSPRPGTVLFDLGGVLIDWDPRHLYRKIFPDDAAGMERFLAEICTPEWNHAQDAGRGWDAAIGELVARFPAERARIVAFRERWTETLGGPIAETVAILRELIDQGRPVYALTNWAADTFAIARTLPGYEFLGWFKGIVVSGKEKIAKPDPRIWEIVLARFGLAAGDTLFIDDSSRNIEAAAALGFDTIRFTSPAALRAELETRGLLAG
jgi:2-haloacid dehalogenase